MPTKSIVLALALTAACTGLDTSSEMQPVCSPAICANSGELAHNGLWEANIYGQPDVLGMSIQTSKKGKAQIDINGTSYDLTVVDARIIATKGHTTKTGQQLKGGEITLMTNGAPVFVIHIDEIHTAPYPDGVGSIELYKMTWHAPGEPPTLDSPLCNEVLYGLDKDPFAGLYGMDIKDTLVFEGDRFDPSTYTTDSAYHADWFNFGCAGHTLAKLELTRHTTHSGNPSWQERQTAMKLLAADYCGDGTSWTVTGTHVMWKDQFGFQYPQPPGALEARWNEYGAKCLASPRLADPTEVFAHCPALMQCTNTNPDDFDGARMVSANL